MARLRRAVLTVVVLIFFVACQGGSETEDDAPPVSATLDVLEPGADVRIQEEDSRVARDDDKLSQGDSIETDATGVVQLDYPDGSLTRLDSDTTVSIATLADGPDGRNVKIELEAGRIWNHVETATTPDAAFVVETPSAVSSVLGTTFDVKCASDGTCLFVAIEGEVQVQLDSGRSVILKAGERLVVGPDGKPRGASFASGKDLFKDDWLDENRDRDEIPRNSGKGSQDASFISNARLEGKWPIVRVGKTTGIGRFSARSSMTFTPQCAQGACDVRFSSTIPGIAGGTATFNGGLYRWSGNQWGDCYNTDTGETLMEPAFTGPVEYEWRVTEVTAGPTGQWIAAAIEGTYSARGTVQGGPPECNGLTGSGHGVLRGHRK